MSYAQVNGLNMYYEIHGAGRPLVLLHGGLSAIGTSFGQVLPHLAKNHQVIAVEFQAHGHTADVPDRPLSYELLADDTVALLEHLGVENADFFGYSVGAGVALQVALTRPHLIGKLVLASMSINLDGLHPGLMEGIGELRPEHLAGTPFAEEYARTAPNPDDWPALIEKIKRLDQEFQGWPDEVVRTVEAPVFVVIGDSDIVRPEHAVEMFRLFGGGVIGDNVGLPKSRLAILPGTTHITLVNRAEWLTFMIDDFLDESSPTNRDVS